MSPTPENAALRRDLARHLACHFLVHLECEVRKPDAVLHEVFKERPVREETRGIIKQVRDAFGISAGESLPDYNLFAEWVRVNGKFSYEDSAFVSYNPVFAMRLLNLREGTPESWENWGRTMRETFESFDYEKQGFTVSFFLDSENIMREQLRIIIRDSFLGDKVAADSLVVAQSRNIQVGLYHYFEGILQRTLEENVRLLHGILPEPIAGELKRNGSVMPVHFEDAAVLFTDFESFSTSTADMDPAEVLRRLDLYFSEFDQISAAHGLEKIKTIGDSYMAVAGVPKPHADPVAAACDAALDMLEASQRVSSELGGDGWNIRIGIHAGPLMAGVIGKRKFSYDVWGATVNMASRMESSGEPGRINVSPAVHARLRDRYRLEARGSLPVKRLGDMEMYFLLGRS